MGRLPPHGARRHAAALCRVRDDGGNAGRAFIARAAWPQPARLEPCVPGEVGAAARDAWGPGMRHGREDRPQRHDPLHPALRGDLQEQGGVGAPPPLGLHAPKQEQPRTALGGAPGPKRAARPADAALSLGVQAHHGSDSGKVNELLQVDRGEWRGRELADQGAQRAGRRLPGIDPAPKRHHHRGEVRWGLTVKCDLVHGHPPHGTA